jgi:hypothetical protein
MIFTPPHQQFAAKYTTEITADFSQSPDALAGFARDSKSGIFFADILSTGDWYIEAGPALGTAQVLASGSVPTATGYRISVMFDGATAMLSINGKQVGLTSHSPVTSTSQLGIFEFNGGTSTETVGLSYFVYSPS